MTKILVVLFILFSISTQAAVDIKSFVKVCGPFKQLDHLLVAQGFSHNQASTLLRSTLIPNKWHLNPRDKFLVVVDAAKNLTEVRFYLDFSNEALVFWKTKTHEGIEKRVIEFKTVIKNIEGDIRGSLSESIKKHVNDEWVVNRFQDAFVWDLNLDKKLYRTDSFKFALEEKYDEGLLVKYGEVITAELKTKDMHLKRVLYSKEGKKVFFDPDNQFEDRPFFAPVNYLHIASGFSKNRFHPIRRNFQPHLGIDFALPEGSNVYAPRDGIVKEISKRRGNGNFIVLEHDNGYFSIYNHLQGSVATLKEGQKVRVGDVIGFVGCTGYCTSSHLHFALRRGHTMYNPAQLTKPFPFSAKNYKESEEYHHIFARK